MGKNLEDIQFGLGRVKQIVADRLITVSKKLHLDDSETCLFAEESENDSDIEFENLPISHLCGEMMDEVMDDDTIHLYREGLVSNDKGTNHKNKEASKKIKIKKNVKLSK